MPAMAMKERPSSRSSRSVAPRPVIIGTAGWRSLEALTMPGPPLAATLSGDIGDPGAFFARDPQVGSAKAERLHMKSFPEATMPHVGTLIGSAT
jgi:hypothetical protein